MRFLLCFNVDASTRGNDLDCRFVSPAFDV
jgi:hypothetical protein